MSSKIVATGTARESLRVPAYCTVSRRKEANAGDASCCTETYGRWTLPMLFWAGRQRYSFEHWQTFRLQFNPKKRGARVCTRDVALQDVRRRGTSSGAPPKSRQVDQRTELRCLFLPRPQNDAD